MSLNDRITNKNINFIIFHPMDGGENHKINYQLSPNLFTNTIFGVNSKKSTTITDKNSINSLNRLFTHIFFWRFFFRFSTKINTLLEMRKN